MPHPPWQDPSTQPQSGQPQQDSWQQQPGPGASGHLPPDPDGFFTPAHPRRAQQPIPPAPGTPPPYAGGVNQPFQAPASQPAMENIPPDERMVYRAPPKQRNILTWMYIGLILVFLLLAVMAGRQFFGKPEQKTAVVTISEQGSTFSGQALVVRNEIVFQQENVSDVRYTADEASAVSRGDPICTVYSTGFSARELERLTNYRNQIKEYHKVLLAASTTPDNQLNRLETMVSDLAQETQALVRGAQGNLLNQEQLLKDAIAQRHAYLKQKYVEDTKLTRLYDNENSQLQRIETWTKQFSASDNGIVSFYTDGYESTLNIGSIAGFSPQQVLDAMSAPPAASSGANRNAMDIYRLVRQYDWGALMLADDLSWNPVVGDQYRMLIESFDSTTVNVSIESVTRAGGQMLVRLKANSPVEPILYTRQARVQLSKSVITYAVPASAIINQDGIIGVVVQYQEGPYLVPVEVVSQDATQAHVVPLNPGFLYEGLVVRLF